METVNKGKSNSAAPSMAFRFNATAEEIEEVYTKEEEQNETVGDNITVEKSESETSPKRSILPLLGKRSTSVDASAHDSSPPSDPWRFLSDIKGKIKSVEVKFTEYKARTAENESSPKAMKPIKDSKENSSLSDSEEASESSISRTCGIVSTTEGVEMSSDDETPSFSEEEKNQTNKSPPSTSSSGIRQRFRVTGKKSDPQVGVVSGGFLETIHKISEDNLSEMNEIESGIDALADLHISNLQIDKDNVLNINQISGSDIREAEFSGRSDLETVFGPQGYVDLRRRVPPESLLIKLMNKSKAVTLTVVFLCLYFLLPLSLYTSGFIAGALVLSVFWCLYIKYFLDVKQQPLLSVSSSQILPVLQIPSIQEHQPLKKYEGWVNEYPEEYNPLTYHVSQTQPVYLRLQGNFLKVSHTRQKVLKRAMWNESDYKHLFTRHRIYNLLGAKVVLLPEGLARVRLWSKKYPICVILNKDQVEFDDAINKVKEYKGKETKESEKKRDSMNETQVFSKLIDNIEEDGLACSDSDMTLNQEEVELRPEIDEDEESYNATNTEWHDIIPEISESVEISPDETRIYLFGRTGRDKEDWFRRLRLAASRSGNDDSPTVLDEYLYYMKAQNVLIANDNETDGKEEEVPSENRWVNAMIARVLFDCYREQSTVGRIRERIQRKLASIRLPYFIQALYCEELNLGCSAPEILGSGRPYLDERGLWLDLDISYEGQLLVILQTKVNLLKLKQQHLSDKHIDGAKPAIYHSDVDDSAESSTDDDAVSRTSETSKKSALDSMGYPVPGIGGISKGGKKFMKMVDRIAESKFFQAATENKFIKKAMQDFSNTDLRLKVELRKCTGKLAINIPPPPTDRIWLGFRTPPELVICAQPIVGDRNISFMHVTSWIEKKIYKEFQKVLVIPNMEDLLIPVMSPTLPG